MKKMSRRNFVKTIGISTTALSLASCDFFRDKKQNFVFILVDDLGWKDTGCYGSTFYETPNIDKLAEEGVRFTNAYAASPVCSPTRASIMTGKYPARLKITLDSKGEYTVASNRSINPDKSETNSGSISKEVV